MVSSRWLGVAGLVLVGGVGLLVRSGHVQGPLWGVVVLGAFGVGAWIARLGGGVEVVAAPPRGSRRASDRSPGGRSAHGDSAREPDDRPVEAGAHDESIAAGAPHVEATDDDSPSGPRVDAEEPTFDSVDADGWHVAQLGASARRRHGTSSPSRALDASAPSPSPGERLEATPLPSPLPSFARIGRAAAVCEELAEPRDAAKLATLAVDGLIDATGAYGGAFLRVVEGRLEPVVDRGLLESADFAHWDPLVRSLRDGSARRVHIEGAGILVGDGDDVAEFVLVSPVMFDGQPHGVLLLASARPLELETEAMVDVARATLSVALENARRGEQLSRLAMIDPLTGLFDRRFGTRRLREEVQRALRAGTSVGLLVVDLDHLETINDDFGRLAGDRLLVQIAHAVRRLLRETDVVVRLGDDELLAVLPEASRADTRRVGERIRAEIAQVATMEGEATVSVTASIGANAFPHDPSSTVDDLIAHAEAAARAARDNGGDRVVLALSFEGEAMTLRRTG